MATSIFDYASLVWDGRLKGSAAGKLFPLKPNVKDLTGDFYTVTRASTKNVLGSAGLYVSVANNVPAFEFNTDGSYKGLLVEPGATNIVPNGLAYNASTGILYDTAVVDTPFPTVNSARITKNEAAGNIRFGNQTVSATALSANTTYTISRFFKYDGVDFATTIESNIATQWGLVSNFTQTINIASTGITLGANNQCTATISNPVSGWYRVSVTVVTGAVISGGATSILMRFPSALSTGQGFLTALPQLETGSVATSPIVTTAGTASRVGDVVTLTGASSLIGQSEGTIYCEINARNFNSSPTFRRIFALSDGTAANSIQLFFSDTSSVITANVIASSVSGASIASSAQTGMLKMAVAYANNDVAFYINGVQIGTDTSVTIPACSKVNIGSRGSDDTNFINDHVRSVALFPTRLANATLASLTA
jgi:hypothetical protein